MNSTNRVTACPDQPHMGHENKRLKHQTFTTHTLILRSFIQTSVLKRHSNLTFQLVFLITPQPERVLTPKPRLLIYQSWKPTCGSWTFERRLRALVFVRSVKALDILMRGLTLRGEDKLVATAAAHTNTLDGLDLQRMETSSKKWIKAHFKTMRHKSFTESHHNNIKLINQYCKYIQGSTKSTTEPSVVLNINVCVYKKVIEVPLIHTVSGKGDVM